MLNGHAGAAQRLQQCNNSTVEPMPSYSRLVVPVLTFLGLQGCQGLDGLAPPGGEPSRIIITAQSGSEVVLTKNVHGQFGTTQLPISASTEPGESVADAVLAEDLPSRRDAAATPPPESPVQSEEAEQLGEIRHEPWRVQPGETLFEAVSRFASRARHTAQKADPYPVWEITADASFTGEFEEALEWLMAGFAHSSPRPILSLYPNGIVRLEAE